MEHKSYLYIYDNITNIIIIIIFLILSLDKTLVSHNICKINY